MTNDELSDCFNDGTLETAAADFEEVDAIDCGTENDIAPETISISLDATEADTLAGLLLGYRNELERIAEKLDDDQKQAASHHEWKQIDRRIDRLETHRALLNRTATLILQTLDANGGSR